MPQDSAQFRLLYENKDLELFDHPLDIILEDGETYVNPEINENDYPWLYTAISTDYELPSNILYEVRDTCYIPDEGESIAMARSAAIDVETIALGRMGYDIDTLYTPTKAPAPIYPKGIIKVYNDSSTVIPLKGVKVRCHNVVKIAYDYTDENGYYCIETPFKTNVNYSVIFDNEKDFKIWGEFGFLSSAVHNMKWHSPSGYSEEISTTSNAWGWAAINNSAYDYYSMCENTGILTPPDSLKIWAFKSSGNSCAPMLRRINSWIGYNDHEGIVNGVVNVMYGYGILATTLNQMFKSALPDVIILTGSVDYNDIYRIVNHELSHASHFSQAGSSFWADYISYIMTYGSYGDGTGRNAELCGIGEMWGYSMGHIQIEEYLSKLITEGDYPGSVVDGWIRPHVFWDLYAAKILTKKQIYDCLTPTVDTYDELVAKMVSKYPSKKDPINFAFVRNEIIPENVNACLRPPLDSIEIGKEFEISWAYATGNSLHDIEYRFVKEKYFDGTNSQNINIEKCTDNKYGATITINKPGYYIIEAKAIGTNVKKYFHIAKHYKPDFYLPESEMGEGEEPVTKLGTKIGDPNTYSVTVGSGNILMQRLVALTRVNYRQMTANFNFRRINVRLTYAGLDTLKVEAGASSIIELPDLYNYQYHETVFDPVDTNLETIPQYINYYTKSFGYYTMKYPDDVCAWIN